MTDNANAATRARVRTLLGVGALAALLWSGYEAVTLTQLGEALEPGIVSLEVAATASDARAIRREWNCEASARNPCLDLTPVARQSLARDSSFIAAYASGLLLLLLWAAWTAGLSRGLTGIFAGCIVVACLCDLAENWLLGITLGSPDPSPFARIASLLPALVDYARNPAGDHGHAVTLARLAAMTKFSLLLVGVAGTLAAAGGAWRRIFERRSPAKKAGDGADPSPAGKAEDPPARGFAGLVSLENGGIFDDHEERSPDHPVPVDHLNADEPRIDFRAADVVGLALSGGGIRSATFNLGLLQGLHRMRLLKLVDYVSTVSGGGYLGSFWSEWLARKATSGTPIPDHLLFPTFRDAEAPFQGGIDSDQERHLREFSGFLAPPTGFFEVETWTAIVAMLAGLVPALLVGLSVLGVAIMGWLALTSALASQSDLAPVPVILLMTLVTLHLAERFWQDFKSESAGRGTSAGADGKADRRVRWRYWLVAVPGLLLVAALQWALPFAYTAWFGGPWPIRRDGAWWQAFGESGLARWWAVAGISGVEFDWVFSPRLFDFGLVWLLAAFLLVLLRLAHPLWLSRRGGRRLITQSVLSLAARPYVLRRERDEGAAPVD